MKFIDWFSGIGAFRLGLDRAGHECVGACEIDPKARRVYKRRFGVPEWFPRDITEVRPDEIPEADLWIGGSPCQGFSPAGLRRGLDDPRSGLLGRWVALLAERRPTWWLMENVPDLLTVRGGRDFDLLLAALDDLGADVAWEVLDAQWMGVPQRRRRVFVLARLAGEVPPPGEVLSLSARGGGHPAAGGEAWANAPGRAARRAGVVGALVRNGSRRGGRHGKDLVIGSVGSAGSGGRGHRVGAEEAASGQLIIGALTARDGGADDARIGCVVAVTASAGYHGHSSPRGDPGDNLVVVDAGADGQEPARTLSTRQSRNAGDADNFVLQCHGSNVGPMGTLRRGNGNVTGGVPFVIESAASTTTKAGREVDRARALDTTGGYALGQGGTVVGYGVKGLAQGGPWHARESEVSACLQSKGAKPPGNEAGTIFGFDHRQSPVSVDDGCPTLDARGSAALTLTGVRRLTVLETELLQGLPAGWTCTCGCEPYSTAACACPDGPRYAMVGNAVAVPVVAWIGRRLKMAEEGE